MNKNEHKKLPVIGGPDDDEPPPVSSDRCSGMDSSCPPVTSMYDWKTIVSIIFSISGSDVGIMGVPSICGWK